MKKRMLAMMMAIVMVMTLLPTSALAVGGDTGLQEGDVRAKKALVLDNENQPMKDADGYYTVQITVQGKPKQAANGSNADVVLVVDNSGSMSSSVGEPCNTPKEKFEEQDMLGWKSYTCPTCGAKYTSSLEVLGHFIWDERPDQCTGQKGKIARIDAAKAVSTEFAKNILAEGTGNRLAVIGFAHNKDNGGEDEKALTVVQGLTNEKNLIDTKIDKMKADGGTNYTAALAQAQEYLNTRTDKTRPGYVIFISDGAPGRTGESLNDSRWNGSTQIKQLKDDNITVVWVPGAYELPLAAGALAKTGKYDAVIALGTVIRGGTAHFEYVAGGASNGLAHVAQDAEIPVAFGVLTTESIEQAIERAGTKAGNKGAEAALTALEMINVLKAIKA